MGLPKIATLVPVPCLGGYRPTRTICIGLSSRNCCTLRFLCCCVRTRSRRRHRDRRRILRRKTFCEVSVVTGVKEQITK